MSPAVRALWQRHGLTAVLGLAAIASLTAIGYETGWGQSLRLPLPPADKASRASDMVATIPGFSLAPLDIAFKESGERPLFTPSRRVVAVNVASAPVMKKGQFKLSGTSVNNDLTVAFLLETATGKTVRVAQGKEINGMTLQTVEPNRAVLKLGDESEELVLRTASSPPVARVTAPAPGLVPPVSGAPQPAGQPAALPGAAITPPPARPTPPPAVNPNAAVPLPGASVLPGFTMPSVPAPAAQATPQQETGTAGQRRRRNTAPQQ